ncbi:MAG: Iron complex outerrane recepter protein [Caulobacteraceae bacterium]|nr:Iron complex outerrane recepter protein [Caulobacteraceae bacterium]
MFQGVFLRAALASAGVLATTAGLGVGTCAAQTATFAANSPAVGARPRPAPGETPSTAVSEVSEVIVTAERRSERITEVPFSIAVIGKDLLVKGRIQSAQDVLYQIPGGLWQQGDRLTPTIGLRGLTSLVTSPGLDIPVSMVIDDVVYPGPADFSGIDYYDVDHVEVLRGPQGTLFGRNTLAGAISVINAKPKFATDYGASFSYGNYNYLRLEGFVNGVLVPDVLAGRLSIDLSDRIDGFVKNQLIPGHDINNDKMTNGRAQLLWTPNADLKVLFFTDINYDWGRANPGKILFVPGQEPSLFAGLPSDPDVVDLSTDPNFHLFHATVGSRVDWNVAGGVLTNIFAYRTTHAHSFRDAVGAPGHELDLRVTQNDHQLTNETRFASDPAKRLNFVVGTFFLYENSFGEYNFHIVPVPGTVLNAFLGNGPIDVANFGWYDTFSAAVFGQANFKITPKWILTAGARFTDDNKSGHAMVIGDQNAFFAVDPTPYGAHVSKSWTAVTPMASLRFEPNPDANFYFTVSRGYQAGGFNSGESTRVALATAFQPEYAWNYELGTKLSLFDHRLQINADVFREDVTNLQVDVISFVSSSGTRNAATAVMRGIEADGSVKLTDRFDVTFNYAYLDDHYINYSTGSVNNAGHVFAFTPKHSVTVGVDYALPLANSGQLNLHGDFQYKSRIAAEDDNSVPRELTAKTQIYYLNANVEYVFPNKSWSVSLWGKNLLDDLSPTGIYETAVFYETLQEFGAGHQSYEAFYNDPRTFGATIRYKY